MSHGFLNHVAPASLSSCEAYSGNRDAALHHNIAVGAARLLRMVGPAAERRKCAMQIQETGAAMSDVLLELNEAASTEGGMTGCLSCSVDVFTVDSAKRFAAGMQVGCNASFLVCLIARLCSISGTPRSTMLSSRDVQFSCPCQCQWQALKLNAGSAEIMHWEKLFPKTCPHACNYQK